MSWRIHALTLILAMGILAATASASQIVEGQVVNAATGAGVPGVKIRIFAAGEAPADGYSATTDLQGRFRIEGVEAGAYRARYAASGFSPVPLSGALAPLFPVPGGGEPVHLEIKMQPLGKISGRVLDAAGKLVPKAELWLIGEDKWCLPPECHPDHRQSKSGENGEFSFTDLVPGPWLLSANAPPSWNPPQSSGDERLGWTQTFYPGVTAPELVQTVILRPGGEQWSTDIKLAAAPVRRIRGRLLDVHGDPVPQASVELGKSFGPILTEKTGSDGGFEFASVIDGEWRLRAAVDKDAVKLKAVQAVQVKNHDLENIELRLTAPFSLPGKIIMEVPQGAPVPQSPPIDMGLVPGAPLLTNEPGGFLVIPTGGSDLTVPNVYPGSCQVQFLTDSPVPYFLDSIRLGDQDALGTFSIPSAALPLTITYKLGGGTVRGTVEGCGSSHVFLIPQDPALRRNGFIRIAGCDQNGRFEFPAVRPGEYYGLATATEPRSFAALSVEGGLLKQAGKLTVRPNESTSADIRLSR
jgi:hypothetical protein